MKEILLNAFTMNCSVHQSSGLWRHPRDRSTDYTSIQHWSDLARTLERGLVDGVFLADVTGVYDVYGAGPDTALRTGMQIPVNDPFCVVPVMASVTEHLCFGVTGTIAYEPPYSLARRFSTLDHLTDGRMAWNVVTGYLDSAAKATGATGQRSHDERYAMAEEYMQQVYGLWEHSWEDDAVVLDRDRGIYTDPTKVHAVGHDGDYFSLDAIHLCEPSPQRTPVIFQAGSSEAGRSFAARHAECVFIGATDRGQVARTVADLRRRAVAAGRNRSDLKIFSLTAIVVGDTDTQAQDKLIDYARYGLEEGSLALMSGWTGIDLAQFDLDDHVGDVASEAVQTALVNLGRKSIRDWGSSMTVAGAARPYVGSPDTVAQLMQSWVEDTDVDGFNVAYTVVPECFDDLVDHVVPALQDRGIYKTAYAPGTMRHKLFGSGDRLKPPHPAPVATGS